MNSKVGQILEFSQEDLTRPQFLKELANTKKHEYKMNMRSWSLAARTALRDNVQCVYEEI